MESNIALFVLFKTRGLSLILLNRKGSLANRLLERERKKTLFLSKQLKGKVNTQETVKTICWWELFLGGGDFQQLTMVSSALKREKEKARE